MRGEEEGETDSGKRWEVRPSGAGPAGDPKGETSVGPSSIGAGTFGVKTAPNFS